MDTDEFYPVFQHYRVPEEYGPGLPFWMAWRKALIAGLVTCEDVLEWADALFFGQGVLVGPFGESALDLVMRIKKAKDKQNVTLTMLRSWAGMLSAYQTMRLPVELYSRERAGWNPWPRGGLTTCQLTTRKNGDCIGIGQSWCFAGDQFCYRLGRNAAEGRALENAGMEELVEIHHKLPLMGKAALQAIVKDAQTIANVSRFKL